MNNSEGIYLIFIIYSIRYDNNGHWNGAREAFRNVN